MSEQVRIDLEDPTGNFWVDNGLVVLAERYGASAELDLEQVQLDLIPKLRRVETDGSLKWTLPATSFIDGQKLKAFSKSKTPFLSWKAFSQRSTSICAICGRRDAAADIKQFIYPLLVEGAKFSNFLPNLNPRSSKICPRCSLASIVAYTGLIWRYQKKVLHLFLFYTSDLFELLRLRREVISPLTIAAESSGNAKFAFVGEFIHETSLGLILELFSELHRSDGLLSEEARVYLTSLLGAEVSLSRSHLVLYAITGEKGRGFNMKSFREFSRLHAFYQLYKSWLEILEGPAPYQNVVGIFKQFQTRRNDQLETIWRDRIAWAILEFEDPLPFIEQFLFEARVKEKNPKPLVYGTERIFEYYTKEVLGMDEQFLKVLKGFGHNLGRRAQKGNEMGLLYALRNAKNLDELHRVLTDILFRLNSKLEAGQRPLTVPEELLKIEKGERICGVPWKRVKNLLSIYAMNAYLWSSQGQSEQQEKEGDSYE